MHDIEPRAIHVAVDENEFTIQLADGRRLCVPLAWFPRLLHAEREQLRNWRLLGDGRGIRWPDLDEDLRVEGLLLGASGSRGHRPL